MFLSGVSRGEFLQPYLVINVTGLVQFGKNLSYLRQIISVKLIYQFLFLINSYLFFRCLEKVFEEEQNENKEGNSRGFTTIYNQFHNILRLLDVLANFSFTRSKTMGDYYL